MTNIVLHLPDTTKMEVLSISLPFVSTGVINFSMTTKFVNEGETRFLIDKINSMKDKKTILEVGDVKKVLLDFVVKFHLVDAVKNKDHELLVLGCSAKLEKIDA